MNQTRMLGYRKGEEGAKKPQRVKRLVFSTFAAVSVLTSCVQPADAIIRKDSYTYKAPPAKQPVQPVSKTECKPDMVGIVKPPESVIESVCRGRFEYVLTNTSLIIISDHRNNPFAKDEGISLSFQYSRTDMRSILNRGLVDWEPSENNIFFLTKDRSLVLIPTGEMGPTIDSYEMPFDTKGMTKDNMIYYSGFLFLAPISGDGLAISFKETPITRSLNLRSSAQRPGFYTEEERLFFGRKGQEIIEIKVEGENVSPIRK